MKKYIVSLVVILSIFAVVVLPVSATESQAYYGTCQSVDLTANEGIGWSFDLQEGIAKVNFLDGWDYVYDDNAKMVLDGEVMVGNSVIDQDQWSLDHQEYQYGGSDISVWGLNLSPEQVNASTFGFALSAYDFMNISKHLYCSGFGFVVPTGSEIDAVYFYVDKGMSGDVGDLYVEVYNVRAVVSYHE